MSFRDIEKARKIIDDFKHPRHIRMAFIFQYLTATRSSEVCGDYAVTFEDYQLAKHNESEESALIFSIKTAKRGGRIRLVALPMNPKYEPWTNELHEWMISRDPLKRRKPSRKIFNFTTRCHRMWCQKIGLNTLEYQIEKYKVARSHYVEAHMRKASTHALRHWRATELIMTFGFDQVDLIIFCGWTFTSGSMDRYIYRQWQRYFPKLLVNHNE